MAVTVAELGLLWVGLEHPPYAASPPAHCSSVRRKHSWDPEPSWSLGRRAGMCCSWPPARDPLTRKKCAGDVLLVGGLAPWHLTSEVSPPKKRALFVVRAWGLAGAPGRREHASGEGVAPEEEKNPLSARSRLPAPPPGNSGQLLGSLACPSAQVRPGQSGVSSYEKRHGGPGCARPTSTRLYVPVPEPLSPWETPLRVTACPVGLTLGCDAGGRVWGSVLSSLDQVFAFVLHTGQCPSQAARHRV